MTSQCRACLNTNSFEFIHLESDFTEEQTYFDCFNECTQLQASWDDAFPNVICQACLSNLQMVYDFIKTAQKSDVVLRSRLNCVDQQKNEIFEENEIENMEIVVLESVEEDVLKETTLDDYNNTIEAQDQKVCKTDSDGQINPSNSSKYACQICNVIFQIQTQLEQHLQHEHNEVEKNEGFIALATCNICNKIFDSTEILDLHMLILHQTDSSGICVLCNKSISTEFNNISEHVSSEHPVEYAKAFKNIDEISVHDEEFIEDCQRTDDDDTASEDFINNKEPSNCSTMLTQCIICNEQLLQNSLEEHMAMHANQQKKFLCSFCPREFKNQKTLRQHEKIHFEAAEDAVHICTDCNRQYSTSTLLEQHRKNTHKLREHVCNICGNAFKLKNQLNNHMKLHLEKNISCPHCDKKYARRFDLNVHLRSHTGEMPFECHLCEKKFAIKVRLTYHLQKHYGIKHSCRECGAEFNSKPKLKAHSFKHTGMPYRCELCDDHGFPNRDVFKRHLLRVHNATITEKDLLAMFQRNTGKSTRICEVTALSE